MKIKIITLLALLPIVSNAQLGKSSLGISLGVAESFNRITTNQPANNKSTNATLGLTTALEWNIPISPRLSLTPSASISFQRTKYAQSTFYESIDFSINSNEKYRFQIYSPGLDLNYEMTNGFCFKAGLQYSFMSNTGSSSGSSATSSQNIIRLTDISSESRQLGLKTQMFRAKIGTYKKLFINHKERFNVGFDVIIPFKSMPSLTFNREYEMSNSTTIKDEFDYRIKSINVILFVKYNFFNAQKSRLRKNSIY